MLRGLLIFAALVFAAQGLEDEADKVSPCLQQPLEVGPCRARFPRWSHVDGKCEEFTYGGCRGTENNFNTKEECMNKCVGKNLTTGDTEEHDSGHEFSSFGAQVLEDETDEVSPCLQKPLEGGLCFAIFPRWSHVDGKCEKFNYGGCGGTENNFHTKEECMNKCVGKNLATGDTEEHDSGHEFADTNEYFEEDESTTPKPKTEGTQGSSEDGDAERELTLEEVLRELERLQQASTPRSAKEPSTTTRAPNPEKAFFAAETADERERFHVPLIQVDPNPKLAIDPNPKLAIDPNPKLAIDPIPKLAIDPMTDNKRKEPLIYNIPAYNDYSEEFEGNSRPEKESEPQKRKYKVVPISAKKQRSPVFQQSKGKLEKAFSNPYFELQRPKESAKNAGNYRPVNPRPVNPRPNVRAPTFIGPHGPNIPYHREWPRYGCGMPGPYNSYYPNYASPRHPPAEWLRQRSQRYRTIKVKKGNNDWHTPPEGTHWVHNTNSIWNKVSKKITPGWGKIPLTNGWNKRPHSPHSNNGWNKHVTHWKTQSGSKWNGHKEVGSEWNTIIPEYLNNWKNQNGNKWNGDRHKKVGSGWKNIIPKHPKNWNRPNGDKWNGGRHKKVGSGWKHIIPKHPKNWNRPNGDKWTGGIHTEVGSGWNTNLPHNQNKWHTILHPEIYKSLIGIVPEAQHNTWNIGPSHPLLNTIKHENLSVNNWKQGKQGCKKHKHHSGSHIITNQSKNLGWKRINDVASWNNGVKMGHEWNVHGTTKGKLSTWGQTHHVVHNNHNNHIKTWGGPNTVHHIHHVHHYHHHHHDKAPPRKWISSASTNLHHEHQRHRIHHKTPALMARKYVGARRRNNRRHRGHRYRLHRHYRPHQKHISQWAATADTPRFIPMGPAPLIPPPPIQPPPMFQPPLAHNLIPGLPPLEPPFMHGGGNPSFVPIKK